ncbi:MAG: kynureninase [Cyclobacteriaceae bacterium]
MAQEITTLSRARELDKEDSLAKFRSEFYIPQHNGEDIIYLCGNSLGLQPKGAANIIQQELDNWKENGVEGHFKGIRPWMHYHKNFTSYWHDLIGAEEKEVVVMNNLTVNLHLLMLSFYRPEGARFKIIMEGHAFPSDQYAVESQVRLKGYDPEDAIIEVFPREGEHYLKTEDIVAQISQAGDELALVLFSGVQYYSGQFFALSEIAKAGHDVGAYVGFDLAHAVGNVPMKLHDWGADFATWCSYKYLNSGPGAVSGIFVHEKFATDKTFPRLAGWWGHNEKERFKMKKGFDAIPTAEGWQLSNAPVFSMAPHLASLELFKSAGMDNLRAKSLQLTGFLETQLKAAENYGTAFEIITPSESGARGCQLSLLFHERGKEVFDWLSQNGVIADWREPDVIRVAPVPIYNYFEDVYRFGELLTQGLTQEI